LTTDPVLRHTPNSPIDMILPLNLELIYSTLVPLIQCPQLAIFPANGWPLLDTIAKKYEHKLKNFYIVRIPGSHHVHMDNPELVLQQILPFLQMNIQTNNDDDENNDNEQIQSKL